MIAKVTLRNLAAHKLRLALTALAVILGVAFVAGTMIFTDTMSKSFDDLFSRVGKGIAVDVRAKKVVSADDEITTAAAIPESLLTTLGKVEGAKNPQGNVTGYAAVIGKNGKVVATQGPPQIGTNWTDGGDNTMTTGRGPKGPGEVAIDEETANKAGYKVGDSARILFQGPTQSMTVVGIMDAGNLMGATITAFDTPTAQKLLLKPGQLSDITLGAQAGVSEQTLRDRVQKVLPQNLEAITGTKMRDDAKSDIAQIMSYFRTFLLVFALISIFVGAFIIFNTFSMLVAQRTKELALLRAVGASRKQVTRAVLGEAVGVGIVGSTLGLLVGVGLAALLQVLLPGGAETKTTLVFTPTPVIWSYVVGITVTVVAAYLPARRAAKVPPVAAMRDDVALPQRSLRIRLGIGSAFGLVGAVLMGLGLGDVGGNPLALLGAGAAMVFLGVAMLAPVISKPAVRVLGAAYPRLFRTPGRMAQQNALRNPRRTAATASALMIGLALVTTVNVLSSSMSASIGKAIDKQFGADFTVASETRTGFSADAVEAVRKTSGVEQATALYTGNLNLDGKKSAFVAGDTAGIKASTNMQLLSGSSDLGADGLLVDEDTAKANRWAPGSTVRAQYPNGSQQQLRIAGIYAKSQPLGPRLLSPAAYQAHTERPLVSAVFVKTAKQNTATKQAVERSLHDYPNLKVQDKSDVKKQAQQGIDTLVAFLTMLLALSIIIAAVGVVNTLALSVIERTREIGLLRAVGTSRRQLRRMIRLESIVITVFGALLGISIGVAFGAAIQHGLAEQGLDVLDIPVSTLVTYVVLGGVIGVLAALWPAWRAGRMDVLKAIATE